MFLLVRRMVGDFLKRSGWLVSWSKLHANDCFRERIFLRPLHVFALAVSSRESALARLLARTHLSHC